MKVAIVPSATMTGQDIQARFGDLPNVLIPIEGKPLLDYLVASYGRQIDQYIVLLQPKDVGKVREYIAGKPQENQFKLVGVQHSTSLGDTINQGLEWAHAHLQSIDQIVINFGDTFLNAPITVSNQDSIYYATTQESKTWTTFHFMNGKITDLIDKQNGNFKPSNVFIGIFTFNNVQHFQTLLRAKVSTDLTIDAFYAAILAYNQTVDFEFNETNHWVDVGHVERYFEAQQDVKARFFNSISIDKQRGQITKSSTNVEKLINETLWYLKLPADVQYLAPRIYNYSLDYNHPTVTMEYYGYSTLHDLYLWSDLTIDHWQKIAMQLIFVQTEFHQYSRQLSVAEFDAAVEEMYLSKTKSRLAQMLGNPDFEGLMNHELTINRQPYHEIKYYLDRLPELLHTAGIYGRNELTIIHGDYICANILVDLKSNIIRTIDPRGKFGKYDIYGDELYDLAKIMHSFDGNYDFIITDQFMVDDQHGHIIFTIDKNASQKLASQVVLDAFKHHDERKYHQAKVIEALLFLSMGPLHKDTPTRQYAMLATGIQLIDQAMKYYGVE